MNLLFIITCLIVGCVFLTLVSLTRRRKASPIAVNLKQSAQVRLKNSQRKQRSLSRR